MIIMHQALFYYLIFTAILRLVTLNFLFLIYKYENIYITVSYRYINILFPFFFDYLYQVFNNFRGLFIEARLH